MEEIIIFNECFNAEGRHIHLYRSKDTGVWAAYGYSAYKVAEIERRNDISIVKNYSKKLLMPVVIMGNDAYKYITSRNHQEEQTADYSCLSIPESQPSDKAGYRHWARSLRDAHSNRELFMNQENTKTITQLEERIVVRRKPVYEFVKRTFDVVVSLICLTVGMPVYLILILIIVICNPGNPFFVQERVGLNGRVFRMIKFRTMYRDADSHKSELKNECESDIHFKIKNDPRITKVGRFLRATSLDETPQAINVLLNHMSIVGPRAYIISEQAQLPNDRLQVKPGLTCYWQITDTTKMSPEKQLELDYKYILERGIRTDLKLIWKTIKYVFKRRNC